MTHTKFADSIIKNICELFEEYDIGRADEHIKDYGQNLILARRNGPVFHVDPLLSISEIPMDILWAEGSGSDYSIGAGHALADRPPEERITKAIDAAKEYCISCGGETFVKKL